MGFVIFFFISWLIATILAVIQKKLSLAENTFVFLIILIFNINFSWIVVEELKLITYSKDGFDYTAFLLNRSVMIPLLLVILVNLFQFRKSTMNRIILILVTEAILLCFSILSTYFKITEYTSWNYLYDAIYYLFLQLIAVFSYKLFVRNSQNVVSES
ncbi:hypothetical protein [Metabacillus sediminilitoris]|uniref:Uncharacterized protein n=1 Tax=Metabacillus sediminilitoris TaxID=2567941 RepID=A0A4S4BYG1_9BACI|nr:hypothetical protein [Metabacillus sediminilitoris]QGQ44563.1 hypothetical protein GMB29_04370 [Metabacillus sediminilitoris]THF80189.1 hypothetical protein E6W99_11000 [Metabacillus sediminilitoris]